MKIRCKRGDKNIDEIIEVSDDTGFDKTEFIGWYISDEDIVDDILIKYWHHHCSDYNNEQLEDFDVNKCRVIINFKTLKVLNGNDNN